MLRHRSANRIGSLRIGFSFTELILVLLIMTVVIGFLIMAIHRLRSHGGVPGEANAQLQTVNGLKQIALACQNFENVHGRLPPAFDKFGEVTFPASVSVHLLPFVEQDELYKRYVSGEGKGDLGTQVVPPLLSPQDATLRGNTEGAQSFAANLRVFSDKGRNTPFDLDMRPLAAVEPGEAWLVKSIPDGTSNTIAFVTKYVKCGDGGSRYAAPPNSKFAAFFGQNAALAPAHPSAPGATFQLQPKDDECRPTPLLGQSDTSRYMHVSMFDGSLHRVTSAVSPRTWNLVVQPNDGFQLGDDWDQ